MPLNAFLETQDDPGRPVFLQRDPDTQQPVDLCIRQVDDAEDRRLRKLYARGQRADQLGKQKAADVLERQVEFVRDRACYALVNSRNFSLLMGNEATAAAFSEALKTVVKVGETLVLDGKWTREVKLLVFRVLPRLASWISDKADELSKLTFDDEEEAAEGF